MPPRPDAVLLDVGGVFLLPNRERIAAAMARAGYQIGDHSLIDRAHYEAVGGLPDYQSEDEESFWNSYLGSYARSLGVREPDLPATLEHLGPEFATMGLWSQVVEGSRSGLQQLIEAGVEVGVVSNADGSIAARLRETEVLQVGPGPGPQVRCIVDSGAVGVAKPDPRIFHIALEAMDMTPTETWYVGDTPAIDVVGASRAGLHPILMDPFKVRQRPDVMTVASLGEVAALVAA